MDHICIPPSLENILESTGYIDFKDLSFNNRMRELVDFIIYILFGDLPASLTSPLLRTFKLEDLIKVENFLRIYTQKLNTSTYINK